MRTRNCKTRKRNSRKRGGTIGKYTPKTNRPALNTKDTPAAYVRTDPFTRPPGPLLGMDYTWGRHSFNGTPNTGWFISEEKNRRRLQQEEREHQAALNEDPDGQGPDAGFFADMMAQANGP